MYNPLLFCNASHDSTLSHFLCFLSIILTFSEGKKGKKKKILRNCLRYKWKNKSPFSFKSLWNSITSNFFLWFGIGSATEFSTTKKRYFCTTAWFLWAIKDQNEFEWRELTVTKVVQTTKGCLLVIWITFAIYSKKINFVGFVNRKIKDIGFG